MVTDCEHDTIIDQEMALDVRPLGEYPVGMYGTCGDCGITMALTGDEDEEGHPTWEPDYTADELGQIRRQTNA